MKELYIETKAGKFPISKEIIEKYNLEKGMRSPFTQSRIVDKNGNYSHEKSHKKDMKNNQITEHEKFLTEEIDEMDNGLAMSTSEILDFSQGVDSSNR